MSEQPAKEIIEWHAYRARDKLLSHIDTMYPGMWEGVATTARKSVRNNIVQVVTQAMEDLEE